MQGFGIPGRPVGQHSIWPVRRCPVDDAWRKRAIMANSLERTICWSCSVARRVACDFATPNAVIRLDPIPVEDLVALAAATTPGGIRHDVLSGALPPAFVAARSLGQIREGKSAFWCSTFYIREPDGTIVGGCGFKNVPIDGRVEIGYAVSPERRRQGIASAAVAKLASTAFASGEVTEVLAQVAADNEASIRVVTRLRFREVGRIVENDELLVHFVLHRDTHVAGAS